jgi:hypothetical protein
MEQLQDKESIPVNATVKLSFRNNTWKCDRAENASDLEDFHHNSLANKKCVGMI